MIDFDEIWDNDGFLSSCSRADAEHFYNAGQQSKIDELQARIDEALTQVNNHKHSCEARKRLKHMSASVSEIAEIEAHESNMYVLGNILKGNKDEN